MAQLWGGRFTKETDQQVYQFNASLSFDRKLYIEDITGSMAHAKMLAKQGIISEQDKEDILKGLQSILDEVHQGTLPFDPACEDIHSFVESNLIERIGDAGKRLHTGRSRNDQVALDMRMYTRKQVAVTDQLLNHLLQTILRIMEENMETYMPGFTHLQKAQPVT